MNVAVVFGGRSVEHDVSIITALQAMEALSARHAVVPIYVTRSGRWLSGEALRDLETYRREGEPDAEEVSRDLGGGVVRPRDGGGRGLLGRRRGGGEARIDVVLPATHGSYGEDGCLQGLLELCDLPYAGSSVVASALAMDKAATKAVLRRHGLPAIDSTEVSRDAWRAGRAEALAAALEAHPLPVYVKPLSLGSSIGVSRCADEAEVEEALELALELDRAALVEASVEGATEVNCAVLGAPGRELRASACEQPVLRGELLSFDDKYLRGGKAEGMKGAERIVPAPIGDEATRRVEELARSAFAALGCAGVARVDFLVDAAGTVYVNELNTIPGSFSFYLWEPVGLAFADLLDELLELALAERAQAAATTRTFASALLAQRAAGGAKAVTS